MNNAINNPKTLARLWAALYCDFESLLARFMGSEGWRYMHFAAICRQMQITLIMHITQGRGKTKDEHYFRITDMIFQMCKDLWLRSEEIINGLSKSDAGYSMEFKRSLGGFYLLYTMYEKQPCQDRVKISLGITDIVAMNKFCEKLAKLPFNQEVTFMLMQLESKKAFHYCIYSTDYRFDASTRNFLNICNSEVVKLIKKMRDTQDVLAYSTVHRHTDKAFQNLSQVKNDVAKDMMKTVNQKNLSKHLNGQSAHGDFFRTVTSESFHFAMKKLDEILDKPVMTLQGLTATEAIDRRIMMETRRRMERARKKALQVLERDGEHKAVRPYVREGGIFGRKKETEEGEDRTKRRERGACNGNLWIYINGHDFDKQLTAPRNESPQQEQQPQPNPHKSPTTSGFCPSTTGVEDIKEEVDNVQSEI